MLSRRLLLGVLTAMAVGWAVLLIAVPLGLAAERPSPWLRTSAVTYGVGALVCHQHADRSFHTASVRWPVCARCTGLYLGGACGLLFGFLTAGASLRRRPPERSHAWTRGLLLAAATPTLLTLATGALGFWDPSNLLRSALAWPLSAVAGALIAATLRAESQAVAEVN